MKCEHDPVILHRTGGPSAELVNICGICGENIERHSEQEPWALSRDVDKYLENIPDE